ncbi:polysaccharide pyruvyl transferase family protein [Chelativorans sp. YIM 93263]|uniref:polysaccharide pyruvyl transferase family protein n=1 Tax=Chelativorans sp. YIM 93263 TaxID=2906648 RepID=UPI00237989CE|nr:polysaccharide pyruvyl transferase family protein [Chelativorans sp. YIM 93263]
MKVGLFGQFGGGNSGNDASLEAMILYLRKACPQAELICFCPNPQKVASDYAIEAAGTGHPGLKGAFTRRLDRLSAGSLRRALTLAHSFRQMRGVDALIVPGTGFLDDYQERPFGWPFMIFRWSLAARLSGAKLAFVSIGAGPITHPVSRWFMKQSARMCHYRSYRDTLSKQFMQRIGCDVENDPVFPDLAFKLPNPAATYQPGPRKIAVGLGVMNYSGWVRGSQGHAVHCNYLGKLTAFARWLLEQDYEIRLLTGDKGDESAVKEVYRRLSIAIPDRVRSLVVFEPTQSLGELMRQISMMDIVVGSRFHNVVGALKLHKPVVSLSYASKNEALLSDIGLHGFSQHVEHFDLEILKRQFIRALANRSEIKEQIANGVTRYTSALAEQDSLLMDAMLDAATENTAGEGKPKDLSALSI